MTSTTAINQTILPNTISNLMTFKKVSKGSFLYFPNDKLRHIFYLKKGSIKTGAYSDEGKEIITAIIKQHEILGEMGLVGQTQHKEYAQTIEDCEIGIINLSVASKLMYTSHYFNNLITLMLGKKLINTQRRLESLVFEDVPTRIINFLCELAHEKGIAIGFEILVANALTHQEIANIVGTSRQTVTTVLNKLRQQNLIYFNRKKLLIRNLQQLEQSVQFRRSA